MKLKQVADDDPSAEFEIYNDEYPNLALEIRSGGYKLLAIHPIPRKEKAKTNRDRANDLLNLGQSNNYKTNLWVTELLDIVDEKIKKAL